VTVVPWILVPSVHYNTIANYPSLNYDIRGISKFVVYNGKVKNNILEF
jgi:hypothetical protein